MIGILVILMAPLVFLSQRALYNFLLKKVRRMNAPLSAAQKDFFKTGEYFFLGANILFSGGIFIMGVILLFTKQTS